MSEFMDDAKKLAGEHQNEADEGFDKATQFAEDKAGGKHDDQIEGAERKAEGFMGVQDQDDNKQQDDNR